MTATKKLPFSWRLKCARLALRGEAVAPDQGIQRIGPDGRVQTLASLVMSLWVPTDDFHVAHQRFADDLEKRFTDGAIDWADLALKEKAALR